MAKTTIEIDVNTGDAAKSLSELKGEFKDLQNTLEKLTPGTKEYIDTLKNLGSVKNDIEDVKKELNAFADGTSNLSAFSGVLSGVVSGFEAASGADTLVRVLCMRCCVCGVSGLGVTYATAVAEAEGLPYAGPKISVSMNWLHLSQTSSVPSTSAGDGGGPRLERDPGRSE